MKFCRYKNFGFQKIGFISGFWQSVVEPKFLEKATDKKKFLTFSVFLSLLREKKVEKTKFEEKFKVFEKWPKSTLRSKTVGCFLFR